MVDNKNNENLSFILKPVGVVRNNNHEPFLVASNDGIEMKEQHEANMKCVRQIHEETSEIILDKNLIDTIEGIEEYSHLVILYWAHKIPEQSRSLTKVHPMGRECFSKVGIFATCSPARPNPILMSVVRLCGIRGNVLEVKGLDAIDGSPVVDIKPFFRKFCLDEEISMPDWMKHIQKEYEDNTFRNP